MEYDIVLKLTIKEARLIEDSLGRHVLGLTNELPDNKKYEMRELNLRLIKMIEKYYTTPRF